MIDQKIKQLMELSSQFIFIEYYYHTDCYMYKIINDYTNYREDKIVVLCSLDNGFERALDLAIDYITTAKTNYFK